MKRLPTGAHKCVTRGVYREMITARGAFEYWMAMRPDQEVEVLNLDATSRERHIGPPPYYVGQCAGWLFRAREALYDAWHDRQRTGESTRSRPSAP